MSRAPSARWMYSPPVPPAAAHDLNVHPIIATLLHRRGISSVEELSTFLASDRSTLHDPFLVPNMRRAVDRLLRAQESRETVAVFGDFDVDGITATLILVKTLHALGIDTRPYIPHRVLEGHGLNTSAVRYLKEQGVSLIATVDCGVSSPVEVDEANALGMDVLITDHHSLPSKLPNAYAIVSTALENGRYPFRHLTGAGIAFKLAHALCLATNTPLEESVFELAALGTVGDVAPLTGENRALVREGLKLLNCNPSPGVAELCRAAGVQPSDVDSEAVSYILAPRLNASGRLEDSLTSYNLLASASREEAAPLADRLEAMNQERKNLMDEALAIARQEVLAQKALPHLLLVASERFNPGVNGLVAGKLVEEFYRPAIVASLGEVAQASARSIPEFNIASALDRCRDLLQRHGGHPRAAGFTAEPAVLPELHTRLLQIAKESLDGLKLERCIAIDAILPLSRLNGEVIQWLNKMQPFGEGNPAPVFLSHNVQVLRSAAIGGDGRHLRLTLRDGGVTWDAIAFDDNGIQPQSNRIDVVYSLSAGSRQDRRVLSLRILDMADAG